MNKITLAIPTNRGLQPKTLQSALEMIAHSNQYDWHILCPSEGYTIAENRNYITVQACNNNSDFLLMIDDDMIFEPDILDRLVANNKDICGVAYHSRNSMETVKYLDATHYISLERNTDPKYKDTFECHATGTGIILIKCDIFMKIPRPWFMFEYYDTGQVKLGEDWFFCEKAKKYGIKTFADPRPKVGHLGEKIY